MNQELGLRILGQIMNWSDERAREEFRWLRLMARIKYDGYQDFQAGMRFIESLTTWLQQFKAAERETAYSFVRHGLVYIGPNEMQRLVEQFYPRVVRERLVRTVAREHGVPAYQVWGNPHTRAEVERLQRQTVFMGLSDGARIDIVRHSNAGILTNEQMVVATQVDKDKWQDLLENLRKDLGDSKALFRLVYLIDDFMGTGTSFLRYNSEKSKWSGKLIKFRESFDSAMAAFEGQQLFAEDWDLCVHHYIGSFAAARDVIERQGQANASLDHKGWARSIEYSFGMVFPEDLPIDMEHGCFDEFLKLTKTYYDPKLQTSHTDIGGVKHLGLGYGGCALPLILDHNTPNNAVALLWAETDGGIRDDGSEASPMRPLFRRRQRHT